MSVPSDLYRTSLSLLTDLYQLTMARAYWQSGATENEAAFNLIFRSNPFDGGYAIACGLESALDYVRHFHFDSADLAYLATLTGADNRPLFDEPFLHYLSDLRLACDIDAMPEGTAVFAQEPLVRVTGPILHCQLLETPLLTLINFQTLIATKAARVCSAAGSGTVIEFGLRRAQGIDGGLTAARAAYVGGVHATSNVLAGRLFDIPVKGTHAHSWVMLFPQELDAFKAYAEVLPNNCIFLVDTYNTLQGVRNAIEVGRWLRERGHEMLGVRLDSGDLAYLAVQTRRLLDEAGFPKAVIVASNELDEHVIESLKQQGAPIDVWGVGTRLVTAFDQPALGGIYKLAAVRKPGGRWEYRIKVSEQVAKISAPGLLQVRRFEGPEGFVADAIYDQVLGLPDECTIVDPVDHTRRKRIPAGTPARDVLVPVARGGEVIYRSPSLHDMRGRACEQLARLHPGIRRFLNPHRYPVGLEKGLHDLKTELVLKAKGMQP